MIPYSNWWYRTLSLEILQEITGTIPKRTASARTTYFIYSDLLESTDLCTFWVNTIWGSSSCNFWQASALKLMHSFRNTLFSFLKRLDMWRTAENVSALFPMRFNIWSSGQYSGRISNVLFVRSSMCWSHKLRTMAPESRRQVSKCSSLSWSQANIF